MNGKAFFYDTGEPVGSRFIGEWRPAGHSPQFFDVIWTDSRAEAESWRRQLAAGKCPDVKVEPVERKNDLSPTLIQTTPDEQD